MELSNVDLLELCKQTCGVACDIGDARPGDAEYLAELAERLEDIAGTLRDNNV